MLRNTTCAVLIALAVASSSRAKVMLLPRGAELDDVFVRVTLSGVSDAGEIINGVSNPTIVPNGTGMGLHQVWMPVLGATPTEDDHTTFVFNPAWRDFDSFWFFTPANSLSIGGAFTETNNEMGGKQDLPPSPAGAARTGFGEMGFVPPSAAKAFTVASGRQGKAVAFGQLVMREEDSVLVSLDVLDNSGGSTRITDFQVGPFRVVDALPGDFNNDLSVDAADYVVWRKNDGNPDGYNTWRANFGRSAGSSSGATGSAGLSSPNSASAPVPEPASIVLLILAAVSPTFVRTCERRSTQIHRAQELQRRQYLIRQSTLKIRWQFQ